jgi:hypothetical protein
MTSPPLLQEALVNYLGKEVRALADAVWVPLGAKAADGLAHLIGLGILSSKRVLFGLPHPSGANADRISYFLKRKDRSMLSVKTSPDSINASRERLIVQIAALPN